ncbi:hypothetical protein E9993_10810 [Labilibacter sediminis]|nr:hypothetical protein E9993_10810 [Labilibacter sediminis]
MKKFLLSILIIIVIAIGAAAIWLATLDGNYDVKRSITVNKSNAEVFNLVQDFNKWSAWSPWLCMEPDAEVNVSGDGMSVQDAYSWSGELVGSGTITHVKIEDQKSIEQDILFISPMESKSFVYWQFNNVNDSTTEITWGMKGEMPFVVRFMTKMMEPMIGMDYERGLKMIKELAEKGYVSSKVEIEGIVEFDQVTYMGEKVACTMDEVGETMKTSFNNLSSYAEENSLQYQKAFSIYHKFDFMTGDCVYTAAIPLKEKIETQAPYYIDEVPTIKALKIKFTGDYEHLPNAWATGMTYARTHKIKENKDVAPFEVYLNNPMEEQDKRKWVTEVYLPVK